jgi:hypothetical protein
VMLGIGGVFPLYAGIHQRAPLFVRSAGLEWLYRLIQEPNRLWGRYRETIPPFVWMALKQVMKSLLSKRRGAQLFTPVIPSGLLEPITGRQAINR